MATVAEPRGRERDGGAREGPEWTGASPAATARHG